jgi:hypothetical protein
MIPITCAFGIDEAETVEDFIHVPGANVALLRGTDKERSDVC